MYGPFPQVRQQPKTGQACSGRCYGQQPSKHTYTTADPILCVCTAPAVCLQWPLAGKVGFVFEGGLLSAAQRAAIRLDPDAHSEGAVHGISEWETLMIPRVFARVQAWRTPGREQAPG